MHNTTIPRQMVAAYESELVVSEDGAQLGYVLTRYAVKWLDRSLSGRMTWIEKLEQLEEMDHRAYRAYVLRRTGRSVRDIARDKQLLCSTRTVQRLLATANHVVGMAAELGDPHALSFEERLEQLQRVRPDAYGVYVRMGYRWRQQEIAASMGVSLSTVKRLVRQAHEYMGDVVPGGLRRHRPDAA